MTISPQQCRAGRALIGWSQDALAARASVSRATIADFERGERTPVANNLKAIRAALEDADVIFLAGNGDGPGVRLRRKRAAARPRRPKSRRQPK